MVDGLALHVLTTVTASAPAGGNGSPAGDSPPSWLTIPMLTLGFLLLGFVLWSMWSAQRPFTRTVRTVAGVVVIRCAPEEVTRPGDLFFASFLGTRPGWGRPWTVTISGPGSTVADAPVERFATRALARSRVAELGRTLSEERRSTR